MGGPGGPYDSSGSGAGECEGGHYLGGPGGPYDSSGSSGEVEVGIIWGAPYLVQVSVEGEVPSEHALE